MDILLIALIVIIGLFNIICFYLGAMVSKKPSEHTDISITAKPVKENRPPVYNSADDESMITTTKDILEQINNYKG